jgi:hypothetical protein
MPELIGKTVNQLTTDNYVSCLLIQPPTRMSKVIFWVNELNANAIEFIIYGSMDGVVYASAAVVANTDVAKNANAFTAAITDPWIFLDLQIRANVGAAQGRVTVYATGS